MAHGAGSLCVGRHHHHHHHYHRPRCIAQDSPASSSSAAPLNASLLETRCLNGPERITAAAESRDFTAVTHGFQQETGSRLHMDPGRGRTPCPHPPSPPPTSHPPGQADGSGSLHQSVIGRPFKDINKLIYRNECFFFNWFSSWLTF